MPTHIQVPGLEVSLTILHHPLTEWFERTLSNNEIEASVVPVDNKCFSADLTFTKPFLEVIQHKSHLPNQALRIFIYIDAIKRYVATSSIRLKCIRGQLAKGDCYVKLMPTVRRRVNDRFVFYPYKFLPLRPSNINAVAAGQYEGWGSVKVKVVFGKWKSSMRTSSSDGIVPRTCNSYARREVPRNPNLVPFQVIANGTRTRVGFGRGRDTHCQAPCKGDTADVLERRGLIQPDEPAPHPSQRSTQDLTRAEMSAYVEQIEGFLATLPNNAIIRLQNYFQQCEDGIEPNDDNNPVNDESEDNSNNAPTGDGEDRFMSGVLQPVSGQVIDEQEQQTDEMNALIDHQDDQHMVENDQPAPHEDSEFDLIEADEAGVEEDDVASLD